MALVLDRTPVHLEPEKPLAVNTEGTGESAPLGATIVPGGVNFSLFSRSASDVELLLSTGRMMPYLGASSISTLLPISLITTGTRLSPAYKRGSFTVTGCRDLSIRPKACDLIHPKFSSTHTAELSSFPGATAVKLLAGKVTIPRRQ